MSDGALALIPARGGSKGIPRKNVIEIAGKPIIAWSIGQALESTRVTRVVVSTYAANNSARGVDHYDIVAATAADAPILDRLTARPAPGSAMHDG